MKRIAIFTALATLLAVSNAWAQAGAEPATTSTTEVAVDTKSIDKFINDTGGKEAASTKT